MTADEIREVLRKRNLKVVQHIKQVKHVQTVYGRGRTYADYYIVIWVDKDKTKYGHIQADYTHRYGIDTLATYNGRTFWFKSNDVADSIPDQHLELIKDVDAGINAGLPVFDPVLIEVSW